MIKIETKKGKVEMTLTEFARWACLAEAFMFLKGPTDMLTLYENRYKTELQKFAAMQIGRRRRDDYTDGEPRIPVQSPTP